VKYGGNRSRYARRNKIQIGFALPSEIQQKKADCHKVNSFMEGKKKFIPVHELEVYRLARKLSSMAWNIYERLTFQQRKVWGDQMLESIDSVGANIVEGYARFHYLEKNRFYYISRASLSEAVDHWVDLGFERGIIPDFEFESFNQLKRDIQVKLNNMIKATYSAKNQFKNDG